MSAEIEALRLRADDAQRPPVAGGPDRRKAQQIEGGWYQLVEQPLSWEEALAACRRAGGNLAVPTTPTAGIALTGLLGKHEAAWCGVRKTASGEIETVTGERLAAIVVKVVASWPANRGGAKATQKMGFWRPYPLNERLPYMCEWSR
jgi:hypothetical protein